ncbi:MAG: hypothetical protein A2W95_13795 [Bacteroidetes bacterium GWA2_40_14]|nr:MAG: hypothetical protein A2W95_13795 [Bacteroidetes bacterium GWA2_40_14]OFZ31832.1 MAG: hypothetical protein A2437_07820 [Bacteroidetes bacterium RIFOXYC2_FULL_40_12]
MSIDKAGDVAEMIKRYDPDVFGLYEVESELIYDFMVKNFPQYIMFLTKGQQLQEILVAIKKDYNVIKFQQNDKFKSGNPSLRPGVFLTFQHPANNQGYAFLFLHTDSGTNAASFGNRTEMFDHALNLKRKLDYGAGREINFIMLGDLNTMGLKYPLQNKTDQLLVTESEVDYINKYANRRADQIGSAYYKLKPNVRFLSKPKGSHYGKATGISDLDHIIASKHLEFKPQANYDETAANEIRLDGWRQYLGNQPKLEEYAGTVSDHCLLYCELIVT